jgi:hypothetical protein
LKLQKVSGNSGYMRRTFMPFDFDLSPAFVLLGKQC